MVDKRSEHDPRPASAVTGKPASRASADTTPAATSPKAGGAPTPSLPKGGGAIRGLGEKFAANLVSGTGSLTIPIAASPGRAGFQPDLALSYDSGGGNGPFGHGFHLGVPAISRKTDKGLPLYLDNEESDVFVLSGAEDLVPTLKLAGTEWVRDVVEIPSQNPDLHIERYRPRVEGLFARIERVRETATGNVYWRSMTKDNVTSFYGRSPETRIADPESAGRIFTWLLEESRDAHGNIIAYEYKAEDNQGVAASLLHEKNRLNGRARTANRYLKRIRYGNQVPSVAGSFLFEVVFDYGEHDVNVPTPDDTPPWPCRPDAFSSCRAGFEIRTYRLCQRVLMFHHMTELGAEPCLVSATKLAYDGSPVMSRLTSVIHAGYMRAPGASAYTSKELPPLELGYSDATIHPEVHPFDATSLEHLPAGVDGHSYAWVDLDGEGLPGVLTEQAGALFYKRNQGGAVLGPLERLSTRPSITALSSGLPQIMDLGGDGRQDLVELAPPLAGYHERTDAGGVPPSGGGWDGFVPFRFQPNVDWSDPNLRFIDLSGDGFEDVLITKDNVLLWYPCLGKEGFGAPRTFPRPTDEEKGPALVFADATRSIFLADMSGDGLHDIVRITNGEIAYWPNLGYGRFGAKVSMTNAPRFDWPERFDPRRARLADIDGTGTQDVLYLGSDGIRFWFNQSGNAWSGVSRLDSFPTTDALATVAVLDLLGTGTACVVWSTPLPGVAKPQMWYIDVLGSEKPHLLTSVKNNLGLETRISYAPSTKFYLEDRKAGRPWVTRLAFPVHVLERVEHYDAVSRVRFVSEYRYHHGYYDGPEREFRGFGLVEQWDTESFSSYRGAGLFPEVPPPVNHEYPQPPVLTKTWFHTGAWADAGRISTQLESEYYAGDGAAVRLPDTIVEDTSPPGGLSAYDMREACRALRGSVLRKEVYALDGTAQEPHPYVVSEQSYAARRIQPAGKDTHGVFFVHPREAIEYHYERNPSDPRVTHAFTLEVDAYGTVKRAAAVGYRRRAAEGVLDQQTKGAITLTENDVFNEVSETGWYRVGVPIETRSYELTAPALSGGAEVFSFDAVLAAADEAEEIAYEEAPGTPDPQKRLLSQSRTLYYANDLSSALAKGVVESLALPYEAYAKAFTQDLLDDVFEPRATVTEAILGEGGYVELDSDDAWWVPSGRQVFSASKFYLPITFFDPFGNATAIEYDTYNLAVTGATDPIGNVVSATIDYRLLAPSLVTDPNGNRAAAQFDELGMVVATAVMGKEGGTDGDTLEDPTATFEYDLFRFANEGKPNVVHARARETHGDAETRWQETYSYSDGSGHEVMRKVQAEPGDAPARDEEGSLVHDEEGALEWAPASPRWVGTGRTVFDNKGNPVKQYEPFFSSTQEYEDEQELVEWGVTPIFHYDPLGRLIRTDLPNGTFSKVVFDPWMQTSFDPNDTVLESLWYETRHALDTSEPDRRAADKAAAHAGTPAVAYVDALGRTFKTIEDNGSAGPYATVLTLDIEGNPLVITDARGNEAMRHRFGMSGHKLHQKSCDAGERWMLADVGGALLRAWDQRGFAKRATYDALRRPTAMYAQEGILDEMRVGRTVFGEGQTDPENVNLRGKIYQQYDGAGVVTHVAYDFKGNLLQAERRLATVYDQTVSWAEEAEDVEDQLKSEVFTTITAYDALNRPVSMTTPDASEIKPTYNEAGLLEKVEARIRDAESWTTFVDDIDYDAKGQREQIVYGNGTTTTYTYDPETFRLTRLKTVRASDDAVLQNLFYTYDPVGNITEIVDTAQQTIFFNNEVVTPSTAYVYDALYRLIEATGREHAGSGWNDQRDANDVPLVNAPHENDSAAVRNYTEEYEYDDVGNILQMIHDAGVPTGSWTRHYQIDETSNRLLGTSVPGDDEDEYSAHYSHDVHGNMTSMPHLATIVWNHADQMMSTDAMGGGTVYFTYDAAGQRVRKVWEHSGLVEERIYIGGAWEVYRKSDLDGPLLERETLHVMDDEQRIAMVETKTVEDGDEIEPVTVVRYQMGNHLGSAALEVDGYGLVISYEEYHPYGTTAYHSGSGGVEVSLKRYRYTGKERDEETGLYYHGARYYAPWLARWTSADPKGMNGNRNLFEYTLGNPVILIDPDGKEPAPPNATKMTAAELNARYAFDPRPPQARDSNPNATRADKIEDKTGDGAGTADARKPGFWERVDNSQAMRVERALATSLANVPNTLAAGLKFIGLGLTGHIHTDVSDEGATTLVPDEAAQKSLTDTADWRIAPRPGTERLTRAYDVLLPLVAAAATGGNPTPGAGPTPGALLADTKKTVSVLGAEAADIAPAVPLEVSAEGRMNAALGLKSVEEAGISPLDANRIQAVANKTGARVIVVGSRAEGKANPWSDWDYIIQGNAKARSYAHWKLPRGRSGGEFDSRGTETGIDIFTDPLDPSRPHVIFESTK